jgi:hypothetical protein
MDCWYEYRCLTAGPCRVWQRRRRCCCPLTAGSWQSIGCCGGSCC